MTNRSDLTSQSLRKHQMTGALVLFLSCRRARWLVGNRVDIPGLSLHPPSWWSKAMQTGAAPGRRHCRGNQGQGRTESSGRRPVDTPGPNRHTCKSWRHRCPVERVARPVGTLASRARRSQFDHVRRKASVIGAARGSGAGTSRADQTVQFPPKNDPERAKPA